MLWELRALIFVIEVWVLHEVLLLSDEWLHLTLLTLHDLGHGLVEEITGRIHSCLSIFRASQSAPSSTTRDGPRLTDGRTLEVRNPLVRTLIALSSHVGLHLDLDGSSSGDAGLSSWVRSTVFNYRILNNKIIVELLGYRVGLGHGDSTGREAGESNLIGLEMALSWEGAVVG